MCLSLACTSFLLPEHGISRRQGEASMELTLTVVNPQSG